jgi:hypothetical protein
MCTSVGDFENNVEYRLTNFECRSGTHRPTLQHSKFVNQYSIVKHCLKMDLKDKTFKSICFLGDFERKTDPSVFLLKKLISINVGWSFPLVGLFHVLIYEAVGDGILSHIFALYSSNRVKSCFPCINCLHL